MDTRFYNEIWLCASMEVRSLLRRKGIASVREGLHDVGIRVDGDLKIAQVGTPNTVYSDREPRKEACGGSRTLLASRGSHTLQTRAHIQSYQLSGT